jgi:histone H1/5
MAAAAPDATLVVEETEVVVASEVVEEAKPEEKKPEKVPKEKKVKAPKEKKPKKPKAPKATKVPTAHPSYLLMVKEAIGSLKERTGSSQYAIAKYLEDTYKTNLPPNFKKTLSIQLRNLTKQGKIYKVKNSFKLSDELKKPTKAPKPVASIKEVKDSEAPKATKVAKKPAGRLKKTLSGTSVPKSPSQTAAAAKPAKAPKSVKASKAETKPGKATKIAGKRKAPAAATTKKVEEKTTLPRPESNVTSFVCVTTLMSVLVQ